MSAKSGPSQPGVLWPGRGLRHGHNTCRGGTVHLEEDGEKGQVESVSPWRWGPASSAFLLTVKGPAKGMVLCSPLPSALQTLKMASLAQPRRLSLSCNFPFALSGGGFAAPIGSFSKQCVPLDV